MPINYKEYHPKWRLISRLIRIYRAKNRCEMPGCGAVNYEPHPVTGSKVILTVAHMDHNKRNNRFSNLMAASAAICITIDISTQITGVMVGIGRGTSLRLILIEKVGNSLLSL